MRKALYIEGRSFLHRLHPASRLVLLLGYFAVAIILRGSVGQWALLGLALACGLLVGAGANIRIFWKFLTVIAVMTVLLWSAYQGGFTWPGLARSSEFAGRICGMLVAGLVFLSVTRVEEFTYAMSRIGIPAPMTLAFGLAFRFVPILIGTAGTVAVLQSLRGLDLRRGSPLARVRRYLPLLVPVLITAMRNVPQLAMALEGRGFGLRRRPTPFRLYALRVPDLLAFALVVVGVVAVAIGRWGR